MCINNWEYRLNKYIYNSSKKKWCEQACFPIIDKLIEITIVIFKIIKNKSKS
jgi:hypothetical protein